MCKIERKDSNAHSLISFTRFINIWPPSSVAGLAGCFIVEVFLLSAGDTSPATFTTILIVLDLTNAAFFAADGLKDRGMDIGEWVMHYFSRK